ncbi:MAG TPA: hypothetical protein VFI31_03305 [Pirellulales bacterium]|nr:hypothetical protein [Pirellulales bacterium]
MIQLARLADGLLFALETLSGVMLKSAFPNVRPPSSTIFLRIDQWHDFQKSHGDLSELVRELAPALTGLKNGELEELGYVVVDADDDRTWVSVPPAQLSGCPS